MRLPESTSEDVKKMTSLLILLARQTPGRIIRLTRRPITLFTLR